MKKKRISAECVDKLSFPSSCPHTHLVTACVSSFPVFDNPLQYFLTMDPSGLVRGRAGSLEYNISISWKQHSLDVSCKSTLVYREEWWGRRGRSKRREEEKRKRSRSAEEAFLIIAGPLGNTLFTTVVCNMLGYNVSRHVSASSKYKTLTASIITEKHITQHLGHTTADATPSGREPKYKTYQNMYMYRTLYMYVGFASTIENTNPN